MSTNKDNFNLWFREIIESLYENENAGFSILMLTFPLLERYLHSKSNTPPKSSFYGELVKFFTVLPNNKVAKQFWQVYRNGILHQATLSQRNRDGVRMQDGWLSGSKKDVEIDSSGVFWVNPIEFAKHVIDVINKDFSTHFEAGSFADHPLAIAQKAPDGSNATSGYGLWIPPFGSHGKTIP